MRCPCCRQPLADQAPACPHCEFNLASAGQYFGQPPTLEFPLTDLAGVLGFGQRRPVRDALLAMSTTFPQLSFAAVLVKSDARVPLGAHAFWLFNAGALTAAQDSGEHCRLVLLLLDVAHTRAACAIGYGLEPFIPQEALDRIAAAALPDLQRGKCTPAIFASLECARREFAAVAETIPRAFGLSGGEPGPDSTNEAAAFAF